MYKSKIHNLILPLFCFLLFALDSYAQTSQPTGYGGISGFVRYGVNDVETNTVPDPDTPLQQNQFGSAVANMGDIDGDGIDDLAVGMNQLTPFNGGPLTVGGVYILLMNAGNTFKPNPFRITHNTAGIQLPNQTRFGISVANIGDFDGDGINEVAVGTLKGKIYILHLKLSGELDSFSEINFNDINTILGNTDLVLNDRFGVSIANLGDIDGDGVVDLAVGAHNDDGTGSVHILFMDKTETGPTLKAAVKLDSTDANLVNGDAFGISVANLGDLDQDGINDLAVGAINDDGPANDANNAGTVHIFYLNRDGSVKPGGFEIFDDVFIAGDAAGRSIANLGDLNGDGINDIAVGAPGNEGGAVFTIFMGKINDFFRIDTNSHPDLNLEIEGDGQFDVTDDNFGQSIANIGDRNEDGVNDLAIGAPGTELGGNDEGALYIVYMDANTKIVNITSLAENGSYDTGTIDIQVIFSEAVTVDATGGTPTLTLETGNIDTPATYTMGSESTVLTFVYTVATGDLATDLDYVSSTSLTLNGGAINATDLPSSTALLTLPKPGTRGSLSSNKNISINEPLPTNTPPTRELTIPIPEQELTANTTFAYTIPTGAFTDADNDPLTYSASELPGWLTLDADTGTFSGAPVREQALTQYTYTVSDGTDSSITDTIGITVNAALTFPLPAIADRNYSPSTQMFIIQLPTATGGTGAITYTLSPVLTDGLIFDAATGRIMVTPTAEEKTSTYTYTAEDQKRRTGSTDIQANHKTTGTSKHIG